MDSILVKVFATALALSQVTSQPDAVKTQFDPARDRAEVAGLLHAGCAHMRKAFNLENIDLDGLIATALNDPRAVAGEIKAIRGIRFDDLHVAYRQFCKGEQVAESPVDIGEVIAFYNKAAADLPDHTKLKGLRLPGLTFVLDGKGVNYAELFEPESRRIWVPLSEIPPDVRAAFIATEDKRFYQHHGVDERSVIRAFVDMLGSSRARQGGSTITQQLAKNLLVGDDFTYVRKIREIIVASRVERLISKDEILELYLNTIFLGRGSWGIEMAARTYFGKSAKNLTLEEGAVLAGLAKGPNAYSPDRHPQRAYERLGYVLSRMQETGAITEERVRETLTRIPSLIPYERTRRDTGYHFVDHVAREAKTLAGIDSLTASSYMVRTTIQPDLQRAAEAALQDGLARYEQSMGRAAFHGAEANLADAVRRLEALPDVGQPAWQRAIETARLPLYDVHWTPAIVIDMGRGSGTIRVGLADGTVLPLAANGAARRQLKLHDAIYVNVVEAQARDGTTSRIRAELRIRPTVQGTAIVIENATGRILAMAGGFSFPLSQLNRATQSRRQPGSALKPLTYLAALNAGLQPNTLVRDTPITLPPIIKSRYSSYARDYWHPRNYDGGYSGIITLRRGLENSKNVVTARLLDGGIADKAPDSLDRICALAVEMRVYSECVRFYPFVLGAQPVRPLDLVAFYAAVANEGARFTPHAIESIERDGRMVYRHDPQPPAQITEADGPAFYQLKSILQGVVARGTARSIAELAPYVGGKTGTSDDWNDAWFIGFTNNVTIGVWVGYDNADGKRRTLGQGQAGSRVALPIVRSILDAVWQHHEQKAELRGPSPEVQRHLVAVPINGGNGERLINRSSGAFIEYFRTDAAGKVAESQYRLVSRGSGGDFEDGFEARAFAPSRSWHEPFNPFGLFGRLFRPQVAQPIEDWQPRPRRVDPDYVWRYR